MATYERFNPILSNNAGYAINLLRDAKEHNMICPERGGNIYSCHECFHGVGRLLCLHCAAAIIACDAGICE